MKLHRSELSRCAAHGLMVLAAALGLWLFGLGALDQWRRLSLYLHQGLGFADPACTTGYCDYTMFWLAGFLLRHGGGEALYDHARFAVTAAQIPPYKTGYWPFIYPPTILLPAVALSFVPVVAGYYGFCLAATGVSVLLLRRAGIAWWCLRCAAGGGAVGRGNPAGARRRFAGDMLCIKPQYALLVPAVVFAGRYWRAMLVGIIGLFALLALSVLLGGAGVWAAYLGPGRAAMRNLLAQPFGLMR